MLTRTHLPAACAALAVLAGAPAQASDSRLRSVFYEAQNVVTIAGRPDIQSTIVFAPDERIENVAIGDSAAWQVTPNKRANLLFLKPQAPRGRTNMTVVTDQRTYLFDLVAQAKGAGPALYALQFTYPARIVLPAPAETTPADAPVATPPDPADFNFAWSRRGSRRLLPARVFDDGRATYLAWDADVPLPAMLTVAPDGTEGPVNYSVRGGTVVVDGVPGRLVLRAGKESASLERAAPSSPGSPAGAARPVTRTAER